MLRYSIEGVYKSYGDIVANDAVTFDVRGGEIFGLLGPNGAGKSTLVKQLVGLLVPDRGRILYEGEALVPGDASFKRSIAYLSQRPLALMDLTVREAIAITGRLRGVSQDRARREADDLIEYLGLEAEAERIVAKLSGGQHRLVGLGAALIGDAATLVLDEPTNELDPEMRRRVWTVLRSRSLQRGATIVLVTHNALEAEGVLERLAVLVDGRVIALGTPGEIKSRVDPKVRIELVFRGEHAEMLERLRGMADIEQTVGSRVVIVAERAEARVVIDRVLQAVSWDDLEDFRVLTPTLEDVYLHVASRVPVGETA